MSGSGTASSAQRIAAFGVAAGGVLLGHWVTYTLAGPHGQGAPEALAHTGHGYLTLANDVALTLALAGVALVFLGRLTRGGDDDAPGWRMTALRLAVFQIAAFGAMETLERLTAGAPMRDLVGLIPVGVAVQGVLAAAGALLIAWLLRAAASIEAALGTAPALPRPTAVSLAIGSCRPRARLTVATDGIRGPPPVR
jgi:hypothetical protein